MTLKEDIKSNKFGTYDFTKENSTNLDNVSTGEYNIWNKWDKLETVMLGDHYRSAFFDNIKNARIRSALQRIADETQEDLEHYEKVLNDFGCNVIRPYLDHSKGIMDYIDNQGRGQYWSSGVPRSPLQTRDMQFVGGNKLFHTHYENGVSQRFFDYNYNDSVDIKEQIELDGIFAPSYTMVGRDIYIDQYDCKLRDSQLQTLKQNIPNLRVNTLNHGGHSDGCFHTIKPGAILSILDIQTYQDTFPGWDVCYLPNQSWGQVQGFTSMKEKVNGKWWVPGEEENDELTHFVETWLQDWVGFVEETVFDVNVLVLDEHHVCVNNMNPTVIEFLKKHNMEPVHVPWRHRYFLDGGLHCITLDVKRNGTQQDYFPERGDTGVIDYGTPYE